MRDGRRGAPGHVLWIDVRIAGARRLRSCKIKGFAGKKKLRRPFLPLHASHAATETARSSPVQPPGDSWYRPIRARIVRADPKLHGRPALGGAARARWCGATTVSLDPLSAQFPRRRICRAWRTGNRLHAPPSCLAAPTSVVVPAALKSPNDHVLHAGPETRGLKTWELNVSN